MSGAILTLDHPELLSPGLASKTVDKGRKRRSLLASHLEFGHCRVPHNDSFDKSLLQIGGLIHSRDDTKGRSRWKWTVTGIRDIVASLAIGLGYCTT